MNQSRLFALALIGGALWLAWPALRPEAPPPAVPVAPVPQPLPPAPVPIPGPAPTPAPAPPRPCPPNRPCPWPRELHADEPELATASVGGPKNADGTEVDCDLPGELHRANVSSRGQGCCVFRSIHHASWWQNVLTLRDFPEWLQKKGLPGGGDSRNVKERITAICRERGVPEPAYLQVEGPDLEILKAACRSGRMPGVTYSFSPTGRYGGKRIAHMVNLVAASDKWFVVLDNNYIGENNLEWLTPAEFSRTYAPGWCVILLNPPPPPAPKNLVKK